MYINIHTYICIHGPRGPWLCIHTYAYVKIWSTEWRPHKQKYAYVHMNADLEHSDCVCVCDLHSVLHIYTCMCVCVYIYTHIYMHAHTHTHIWTTDFHAINLYSVLQHVYIHTRTNTCIRGRFHVCLGASTYVSVSLHIYINTYIHTRSMYFDAIDLRLGLPIHNASYIHLLIQTKYIHTCMHTHQIRVFRCHWSPCRPPHTHNTSYIHLPIQTVSIPLLFDFLTQNQNFRKLLMLRWDVHPSSTLRICVKLTCKHWFVYVYVSEFIYIHTHM
jgi:hypothetical protein